MNDELRLQQELVFDTYKTSVGNKIAVLRIEQNVLMTAKEIAKLYGVSVAYIRITLRKLYLQKVLVKKRVSNTLTHRADDGKLYETRYYNAEAIVAVGLSIKSPEAVAFREWVGTADIKKIS
jgi:hypothetical protein